MVIEAHSEYAHVQSDGTFSDSGYRCQHEGANGAEMADSHGIEVAAEEVRVKLFDADCRPLQAKGGDWVDLRSRIDISYAARQSFMVPLGVAMELPDGYEAHVAMRSSSYRRYGVIQTNGVGVIDHSYRGDADEWKVHLYATHAGHICKGDRIAQFRIVPCQPKLAMEYVERLGNASRGGFGSTGRR